MKIAASILAGLTMGLGLFSTAGAAAPGGADWTLDIPKAPLDMAHLIYVEPTASAPLLAFSCRKKTGQLIASFDVPEALAADRRGGVWVDSIGRPAPWPISVTLASATERTTLRGQANPNARGGSTVSVEAADRAPVIAEWRKTTVLTLDALDRSMAAPSAKKSQISRFLRFCG